MTDCECNEARYAVILPLKGKMIYSKEWCSKPYKDDAEHMHGFMAYQVAAAVEWLKDKMANECKYPEDWKVMRKIIDEAFADVVKKEAEPSNKIGHTGKSFNKKGAG